MGNSHDTALHLLFLDVRFQSFVALRHCSDRVCHCIPAHAHAPLQLQVVARTSHGLATSRLSPQARDLDHMRKEAGKSLYFAAFAGCCTKHPLGKCRPSANSWTSHCKPCVCNCWVRFRTAMLATSKGRRPACKAKVHRSLPSARARVSELISCNDPLVRGSFFRKESKTQTRNSRAGFSGKHIGHHQFVAHGCGKAPEHPGQRSTQSQGSGSDTGVNIANLNLNLVAGEEKKRNLELLSQEIRVCKRILLQ